MRRIEISSFWSRSSERVLVICVGAFVGTDLRVLWEWVGEEAFWRWSDERLGECVCVAWERLVMGWDGTGWMDGWMGRKNTYLPTPLSTTNK